MWARVGLMGSVALGSVFWSQKNKTETSPYELKLIQVLFRHGARTPLKSIPDVLEAQWVPELLEAPAHTEIDYMVTDLQGGPRPPAPVEDSYRSKILTGGTYPGQLTTLGMQQLYDLGVRLRKKYIQEEPFLTPSFNPKEVYIRSTNIVRTIESAKCLVAGLFQQEQAGVVSILTDEAEKEILYPNYHGCKLLKRLIGHRWAESSTVPDIAADLQSIQRALGVDPHQHLDFILIRDDMVAREAHGLPLPTALGNWRSIVEQRAVDMMYHIYEPSKRLNLQMCVGPLFHTLLTNIEDKIQGTMAKPDRTKKSQAAVTSTARCRSLRRHWLFTLYLMIVTMASVTVLMTIPNSDLSLALNSTLPQKTHRCFAPTWSLQLRSLLQHGFKCSY
uniref:Acid phosphatase 6, lysophosphatidic n=1 Tax=Cyprinus carpio carpio TaxID=630221 RepID=A0A9J7YEL1_CYPCA